MPRTASVSEGLSRLRPGMGTFVAIEAQASSLDVAREGLEGAYRAVRRVEQLMHPSRSGSDLAVLRGWPAATPLTVHPWTWRTLELCRRLHDDSRGLFDPCLPGSPGRFGGLELRPKNIVVAREPLHLDLGGIAKGFAVDRAIDALREAGCQGGLVNAGGDLAVFGHREYQVHCRRRDGRSRLVTLRNAALATSEAGGDAHPVEHQGYYGGRHGRQGRLADFAAVTAPTAAVADGLTKCLLAGTPRGNALLLRRHAARRVTVKAA